MDTAAHDLESLLLLTTAGELAAFQRLEAHPWPAVQRLRLDELLTLPELAFDRTGLLAVLRSLQMDMTRSRQELVSRWAIFVLHGFVSPRGQHLTIDTDFEVSLDQLTVDILQRLIDIPDDDLYGPLTTDQIDEWNHLLETAPIDAGLE